MSSFNSKMKSMVKKVVQFAMLLLLCIVVLLGGWCVPPKMVERVIEGMKAKFNTEFVLRDERDSQG